ncbi:carboxylate--amine ligase [Peptostreptococcus canis]|uniref:Carboxylate--amine ligase n=1 Tax=Peptostreptococcus canis TaxID=1159213 RepID=A0ABR6TKH6_9FIRM|nr:carboxylate--amine ligase [Peptostreptococcus canis]MBC2575912.1 carboxylate--amine ligase [Peptostreptococcus canis]MBP1997967.1 D-aspartate ligase [Peptostreptococcus canis]
MENLKIQPILCGGDLNCYSVARAFHEQYGVKSIAFGRYYLGATKDSKIIDFRVTPDINDESKFVQILLDEAARHSNDEILILMGCTDEYAELIIDNRDKLKEKFVVPYIDSELKNRLVEKESFYSVCEEYGLDYPKTYIYNKGDETREFGFKYPVIVKASDSISFFQNPFEGMNKAYIVHNQEEFDKVIKDVYSHGYEKSMIIQDFIPGEDENMRVLTCYSDQNAKVKMMCLGHVLLEEHTPKGIGNHAAIITEYEEELMEKYKNFLEKIGYVGFSNFDIKYDDRDGKFKVFEINLRQGRSNFYVTSSGNNIAKYVVEDRVYNKEMDLKIQKDPFYWHVIPNSVVYKYVHNKELVKKCKELVASGKSASSYGYKYDLSGNFKRSLYIFLYNLNQKKKFRKYCR